MLTLSLYSVCLWQTLLAQSWSQDWFPSLTVGAPWKYCKLPSMKYPIASIPANFYCMLGTFKGENLVQQSIMRCCGNEFLCSKLLFVPVSYLQVFSCNEISSLYLCLSGIVPHDDCTTMYVSRNIRIMFDFHSNRCDGLTSLLNFYFWNS